MRRRFVPPSSSNTPPFTGNILAWWDNRTADFSTTGALIDTWTDRVNGNVLTGTTTTRPSLVAVGTTNYVQFASKFFAMPGGFGWNMQGSSFFIAIGRSAKSSSTSAIWKMNTTPPVYDGLYLGGQRLSFLNQSANNNSDIYLADGLACISRIANGATSMLIGGGNQQQTFNPNDSGTISAGGYLGEWETPPQFPLDGSVVLGVLVYNRTITTGTEYNAVMDFFTRYYRTASRTSTRLIVEQGDSLTQGTGSSNEQIYNWPAQMMRLRASAELKYANVAVAGTTVGDGNTAANEVLTQLGVNLGLTAHVAVTWKGTNDLESGTSAATLESGYTNMVSRIHSDDPNTCVVVACTIIARNFVTGGANAQRLLFNTWMNAGSSGADYVVDLAADPRLSDYSDTTYYDPDGIHLNDTGYAVVASLVKAVLDAHGLLA